jgi:hypothetical protein
LRQRARTLLSSRSEHRLLALMLVLLHIALWWDFPGAISRSLMLAHLGAFLLWQPLWSRDSHIERGSLALFSMLTVAFTVWLNWWLIAFWLILLLGLVGARVGQRRTDRAAYMIGGFFLGFELLIRVVPEMFAVSSISADISKPLGYALFSLPVLLAIISGEARPARDTAPVDFLYGLTVALLVIVLVLGTLLSMYHFGAPYPVALFQTVIGIALFLLAISWLWTPFAGFAGFGQMWTRYLLNIGTPFERWLREISRLAAQRQTAEQFLKDALAQIVGLPWVSGCEWKFNGQSGLQGVITEHSLEIETRELRLVIFTPRPITTALQLHGQLLVQLVADFHQAKRREIELAQKAHLQAIHETGARVTHDIKNLLQSMYAMTGAVQHGAQSRPAELQELLAKQLPQLTQRLQLALDKLQAPQTANVGHREMSDWWEALKRRNDADGVHFNASLEANPLIPSDCFDSVLENLLENARYKRKTEPHVQITVSAHAQADFISITVLDSGSRVDSHIAASLFSGPVRSASGLGIGLFQAQAQAQEVGYELRLSRNEHEAVEFEFHGCPRPNSEIMQMNAQARRIGK